MYRLLEENLVRQNKALMLLYILLEEEFTRLMSSNPQGVSQIELSIQELMRQIASERLSLRKMIGTLVKGATRVRDLYLMMDDETRETFQGLVKLLEETQQKSAVQAAKNNEMAKALFDQSKGLLKFMHDQIKPKNTGAYGSTGRFAKSPGNARILTGRL
ncbi:flagellar export chaperone FlgN [Pseudodesulfovibrio piezophilus]|uniref:FlgN protein n=1 Tax=Pseudodesulfovibrio piezophilus (strain DSM 21447 / JCM 15486 / C1TLV30) TaxID=1322246 RepID=M1WQZ8_PSEP2|nr:flagellar export chaperone FlgN [Pseudodesulfovibrio piezophilus]CCH47992.1 FlgN protein [Pseudodesulfovibrio piezophilus C1TLV30]